MRGRAAHGTFHENDVTQRLDLHAGHVDPQPSLVMLRQTHRQIPLGQAPLGGPATQELAHLPGARPTLHADSRGPSAALMAFC